jgi:hypothetical protein
MDSPGAQISRAQHAPLQARGHALAALAGPGPFRGQAKSGSSVEVEAIERNGGLAVLPLRHAEGDVAAPEAVERMVRGQLRLKAEVAKAVPEGERRLQVFVILYHGPAVVLGRFDVELGAAL